MGLRVIFAEDNFLVREGTAALLAEPATWSSSASSGTPTSCCPPSPSTSRTRCSRHPDATVLDGRGHPGGPRHPRAAPAGALGGWLALWITPTFALMLVPARVADRVAPLLPGEAGTALADPAVPAGPAWLSFAVFVGWAVLLTAAAAVLLRRRDA